jgi:hypothetical protein
VIRSTAALFGLQETGRLIVANPQSPKRTCLAALLSQARYRAADVVAKAPQDLMQISQRNSYHVSRTKNGGGNSQKQPFVLARNRLSVESDLLLEKEDFDDSNTQ